MPKKRWRPSIETVPWMAAKTQALSGPSAARPEVIKRKTGRTLGQAFLASPPSDRRKFLLEHIRATVRTTPRRLAYQACGGSPVVGARRRVARYGHDRKGKPLGNTKILVIVGDDQGQSIWLCGCNENC